LLSIRIVVCLNARLFAIAETAMGLKEVAMNQTTVSAFTQAAQQAQQWVNELAG